MATSTTALEMRGIRKEFPGVVANDGVDFTVAAGEIVGLLGENGAGKSTLMNILAGLLRPDAGEIRLGDRSVTFASPLEARRAGIGMVHQHFMLVPNHTVLENLVFALPDPPLWRPDRVVWERLDRCAGEFGLRIDPDAFVWQLSAGEQQRVEILKALIADARWLILDEPTSVLTPQEADELLRIIRILAGRGHGIILITHKLEEILACADRITILRHGRVTGAVRAAETDRGELARLMVGREVAFDRPARSPAGTETVLELTRLEVPGDRGVPAVREVSLNVAGGEILGLAGVAGNGQKELIEALAGLRPIAGGIALFRGTPLPAFDPRAIAGLGIAHIPEERFRHGVAGPLPLLDNAVLNTYHQPAFSRWGLLDNGAIRGRAEAIVRDCQVAAASLEMPARQLSGGNAQKFIVGRELAGNPRLILAAHPTTGVDVGAAELIHGHLLSRRASGAAVILASEDLSELFRLSDRLAVFCGGRCMGIVDPTVATVEAVGLMMGGSRGAGESGPPA